jgi:hypothetical protein
VRVEVFSEKRPDKAEVKVLDKKTVARIVEDFQRYFARKGTPSATHDVAASGIAASTAPTDKVPGLPRTASSGSAGIKFFSALPFICRKSL